MHCCDFSENSIKLDWVEIEVVWTILSWLFNFCCESTLTSHLRHSNSKAVLIRLQQIWQKEGLITLWYLVKDLANYCLFCQKKQSKEMAQIMVRTLPIYSLNFHVYHHITACIMHSILTKINCSFSARWSWRNLKYYCWHWR